MADQIRRLSLVVSFGFLIVALGLGYWQVVAADSVLQKPSNPRLVEEEVLGRVEPAAGQLDLDRGSPLPTRRVHFRHPRRPGK